MRSYMDVFPFPFYALVKNIQQLPSVLAESLRQWLELTTANSWILDLLDLFFFQILLLTFVVPPNSMF